MKYCRVCLRARVCKCVMNPYEVFFFFFSSRRRHTRSLRDWSSDVCSSDLKATMHWLPAAQSLKAEIRLYNQLFANPSPNARSEERRVGKECRSRWSPDD